MNLNARQLNEDTKKSSPARRTSPQSQRNNSPFVQRPTSPRMETKKSPRQETKKSPPMEHVSSPAHSRTNSRTKVVSGKKKEPTFEVPGKKPQGRYSPLLNPNKKSPTSSRKHR